MARGGEYKTVPGCDSRRQQKTRLVIQHTVAQIRAHTYENKYELHNDHGTVWLAARDYTRIV